VRCVWSDIPMIRTSVAPGGSVSWFQSAIVYLQKDNEGVLEDPTSSAPRAFLRLPVGHWCRSPCAARRRSHICRRSGAGDI